MVLFRAFKKIAYPKRRIRFPRYRNPFQYVIADAPRRRRKTHKTMAVSRHVQGDSDINNISNSNQTVALTNINSGQEMYNRLSNTIYLKNFTFKALLLWQNPSTPNNQIRVIVWQGTKGKAASPPSFGITSNIYGRGEGFEDVRHVYFDRTYTSGSDLSTADEKVRRMVKFAINLRGLKIKYTDGTGTNVMDRDLYLTIVGDTTSADSAFKNVRRRLHWGER